MYFILHLQFYVCPVRFCFITCFVSSLFCSSETVTQNIRYVERNAMERGSGVYETIGPALPNRPCATKQLPPETTKAITAIGQFDCK